MFDRSRLPDPLAYYESQGLDLTGWGRWRTTRCEFHGGSDSMRINIERGGFCCMNCQEKGGDVLAYDMAIHGGTFVDAAKRLGAWVDDPRDADQVRRRPLPFNPRDALEVLAEDAFFIAYCALYVHHGGMLTDGDRAALLDSAGRVDGIAWKVKP
ncbi:CHC2 zinc finger domain-containing protein [Variovorax sp. Sphag1AA]|uniref:CHC2 zinc finger domain-containing protein n=1 Tax=Variovorax sp. Sphag1AA TaxID=2587027 RepID=UPI0017DBDDF4|nr:CHC2 zinc finger domain-containing protein [Variovorax sp. Sphag1AA]MBB3175898.1 hypothetical protein [Variovorax sp. Sphag1AA]